MNYSAKLWNHVLFSSAGGGNSRKLFLAIFSCFLTLAFSAPCVCPQEPALWENPCGTEFKTWNETSVDDNIDPKMWRSIIFKAIKHVHFELKMNLYFYDLQNLSRLYDQVTGITESNQFSVPKWLPGKGDVESLNSQIIVNEIPNMLKMFYTDLQKFAIAFEQMLKDETEDQKKKSINEINVNLNQLLCEVKSSIIYLQMGVPVSLHRSIMSEAERHVTDSFRTLRDYGILKRYGEFIKQWRVLVRNIRKRRRRRHASSTKNSSVPPLL